MSQGSPIVCVRIPNAMRNAILTYLETRSLISCAPQWNMTDFILEAVKAKLAHIDRSKSSAKRRYARRCRLADKAREKIMQEVVELAQVEEDEQ